MENKLSFNINDVKIKNGLPKALKFVAISAFVVGSVVACEEVDSCTTTRTDTGSVADLGAQQDPNSRCDND